MQKATRELCVSMCSMCFLPSGTPKIPKVWRKISSNLFLFWQIRNYQKLADSNWFESDGSRLHDSVSGLPDCHRFQTARGSRDRSPILSGKEAPLSGSDDVNRFLERWIMSSFAKFFLFSMILCDVRCFWLVNVEGPNPYKHQLCEKQICAWTPFKPWNSRQVQPRRGDPNICGLSRFLWILNLPKTFMWQEFVGI